MTTKLEQAARQALNVLAEASGLVSEYKGCHLRLIEAVKSLREALAEQAEQKLSHKLDTAIVEATNLEQRIDAALEMVTQEPVAWMVTSEGLDGTPKTYPLTGRFKDVCDMCDFGDPIPLYAAPQPVKEVELTDEEIAQAVGSPLDEVYLADFRSVIAKYKEKNTC